MTDRSVPVDNGGMIFIHYNHEKAEVKFVYSLPGKTSKWDKADEILVDLSEKISSVRRGEMLTGFLQKNGLTSFYADLSAKMKDLKKN